MSRVQSAVFDGTLKSLDSIADLRAAAVPSEDSVIRCVDGFASLADSGGGMFVWDSSSSASDNDATVILPTGHVGNGRWRRVLGFGSDDSMNVRWFGAKGDGSTDDTTDVQQALTAAVSAGKALFFPPGNYRLSAKLTASAATAIRIIGSGRGITKLVWADSATGGGGIDITYTDVLFPPMVSDLSLYTEAAGSGTALKITGPESASVTQYGPVVRDLQIQGGDLAADCWDVGIHFYTCWYIGLSAVNIKGKNEAGPTFTQSVGIQLTSCQVCYMNDFNVFHVDTAVYEAASGVATHGEGFAFTNFEFVGVGTGIELAADDIAPGTNIGPGHINSFYFGLNLQQQYQTSIHDLLMYKTASASSNYIAIQMDDCNGCHVHNNEIHGESSTTTGTTQGIVVTGTTASDYNSIHDNRFRDFYGATKVGIVLGTGVGNSKVHNNDADSTVTTCVQVNSDADKTNVFFNNQPMAAQTFTANDTTPSVGNDLSGVFITANSGATTITTFDDSYVGQEIEVLVNDANTTFQHNVSLIMKGAINYAAPNGTIMKFRRYSGLWREVSRSA